MKEKEIVEEKCNNVGVAGTAGAAEVAGAAGG